MTQSVKPDCAVSIKYAMKTRLPDGTVKERPIETAEFIYGVESQVPTLENALDGATVGDKFNLHVPSSELYGEHDTDLIREIPKKGLIKQRIKPGQYYRQMKKGCLISFKVLEVRPNTVLADFNKPMAGISVGLEVEVLSIREASKVEIDAAYEAKIKRSIGCG